MFQKLLAGKKRTIPKKKTSKPVPVYRSSSAARLNKGGQENRMQEEYCCEQEEKKEAEVQLDAAPKLYGFLFTGS